MSAYSRLIARGMPWQLLVLKFKLTVDAGDAGVYFTPLTASLPWSLAVHFAGVWKGDFTTPF